MNWPLIASYSERILPGCLLAGLILLLLPRRFLEFRICIYIGLFILLRDVMTPLGVWRFGTTGFFWIRVFNEPLSLIFMALCMVVLIPVMNLIDPDLKALIVWKKAAWLPLILAGAIGALAVAAPSFLLSFGIPIGQRGGPVTSQLLGSLLIFAMLGNLYEEVLFRGYLQGYLEKLLPPLKAAILGGFAFSFGHIFLATTVTDAGPLVLAFTLYEGLIAGIVRMKFGVLGSTITHGGGIFLLLSGWF
ncbi:MAG TPA: CPBP family intramembrane glutamic endopeptidase [Chthoniobacterales bacterium]|nr:CPBP family intramembrane glutamic endopeptidase [Chthoniobacterales bacterium]